MFIFLVLMTIAGLVVLCLLSEERPSLFRNRAFPRLEALEPRECPAGFWDWNGALIGSAPWSNPGGTSWLHNGAAVQAGEYPGKLGSFGDIVRFNNQFTGSATLDVALFNDLRSLQITNWFARTLTLDADLKVSGSDGQFLMNSAATISIGMLRTLTLEGLGQQVGNFWTAGTVTGAAGSRFKVAGSLLQVQGAPAGLGTDLFVTAQGGLGGGLVLSQMSNNLFLNGTNNIIDVQNGGGFALAQQIGLNQQPDSVGGIALTAAHTGTLVVKVEVGGTMNRSSSQIFGGPDNEVSVSGMIQNLGGTVQVSAGAWLNITGMDADGHSYWQKDSASAKLQVDAILSSFYGKIKGTGTFQIDTGTVQLASLTGGSRVALDSAGLLFGGANATYLTIVDGGNGPGWVWIKGSVYLGQNTRTTLNYKGATNTATRLLVENGPLTLQGTLYLNSEDGQKPTQPLDFFDDFGANPAIFDNLTTITGSLMATYSGEVVVVSPNTLYYRVTIT